MLEDALLNFAGTVIAVSHDRYFLKRMATRVVEISDGELADYRGDYSYYLEKARRPLPGPALFWTPSAYAL